MKIRTISNFLYKFKIFKRIVPSLLKVMVKFFYINEIKVVHNNLIFLLNPKNPIDREIYLKDKYSNTGNLFAILINRSPVIVDSIVRYMTASRDVISLRNGAC